MVRATGLFHATLPVRDLDRSERFWRELLGIQRHATPSYHPGKVVFLDLGNTMLHLVRYGDEAPWPDLRSTHLAITVDDLDGALAAVKDRGLQILREPFVQPDGARSLYFVDPDGNRVEFVELPPHS